MSADVVTVAVEPGAAVIVSPTPVLELWLIEICPEAGTVIDTDWYALTLLAVNAAVAASPGSLPIAATVLEPGRDGGITRVAVKAPEEDVVMEPTLVVTVPLV